MYPHQRERLGEALARAGAEVLVATSAANVAYLTDYRPAGEAGAAAPLAVFSARGTALVLSAAEAPAALAGGAEADHVVCHGRLPARVPERPAGDGKRLADLLAGAAVDAPEALARALEQLGAGGGAVAVDEARLPAPAWPALSGRLGGRPLVPGGALLGWARRAKAPWEIECLHRALGIAEEALDVVVQGLDPGVTEREAAALFAREVVARDGRPVAAVVLFGDRTALPRARPGDRRLKRGDLVRLDVAAAHRGYHALVARTAVMGEADPELLRRYEPLEAGLEAALRAVRAGRPGREVVGAAAGAAREAGLAGEELVLVAQGVGLESREEPALEAGGDAVLEMGEVIHVELAHYELGRSGLAVRDTLLVTDRSSARMNRSTASLVLLD
jgi:Xaa-Pro aminopeptidase